MADSGRLKPPFPWLGGKGHVAEAVWSHLGCPAVYSEPFAGSLAVLLASPVLPGRELVCDTDGRICNFWRAVQSEPEAVAKWADWPTVHQDLEARHRWLRAWFAEHSERLRSEPDFYDAKVAGWWVWGLSCWPAAATGWCTGNFRESRPNPGMAHGVQRHRKSWPGGSLEAWMRMLARRLAKVVVLNRSWESAVSDKALTCSSGQVAVFLDPPYLTSGRTSFYESDYDAETTDAVATAAWRWATAHGSRYRVVYCCRDGDVEPPDGWFVVRKSFLSHAFAHEKGTPERSTDCLLFSPACSGDGQSSLFA